MSSTVPTNLLAEESTIDPTDPFPSFYEIKLLEATSLAAEKAVHTSLEAIIDRLYTWHVGSSPGSYRQKLTNFLAYYCSRFQAEIECIIHYIIHRKTLVSPSMACTISESFYSLKRSKVNKDGRIQSLTKSDGIRAALLLALIPYTQRRLDELYQQQRDSVQNRGNASSSASSNAHARPKQLEKMQRIFVYVYPWLNFSHQGAKLAYQFAYLIGKTRYHDPWLHVLGQIVRRITLEDLERTNGDQNQNHNGNRSRNPIVSIPPRDSGLDMITSRIKKVVTVGVASALLLGWMGKFRQEIRRHRNRQYILRQKQSKAIKPDGDIPHADDDELNDKDVVIPPPPKLPSITNNLHGSVKPNKDPRTCPICGQKRINAAASSSGYVFCYKCLTLYIRKHGPKCPVSGLPCEESQIVRLFEPHHV